MLINILDPALLIYTYEDFKNNNKYCIDRLKSLNLHRNMLKRYEQKIVISKEFFNAISQYFPWNQCGIPEFRDLMLFMFQDMQRMQEIVNIEMVGSKFKINVQPKGILCKYVEQSEVIKEWEKLLYFCIGKETNKNQKQIDTWDSDAVRHHGRDIEIIIDLTEEKKGLEKWGVPIIWNEDTWFTQLATQDWWPDLNKCIEVEYRTNQGMQRYSRIREEPFGLECEESFWQTVGSYCESDYIRKELIEALTKLIYGVRDEGLSYTQIGEGRYRFRVTIHYRIHCRFERGNYMLERFEPREATIDGIG